MNFLNLQFQLYQIVFFQLAEFTLTQAQFLLKNSLIL